MSNFLYPDQEAEQRKLWLINNGLTEEDLEFEGADSNADFRYAKHTGRIPK